ncbi:MAG: FadR family transcriptional regulator [Rubrobacter sp.]|nr:FadR family transcriptional regulator [Rubrobacter sp.]
MSVLQPGTRLPSERKLCERFGAGRSSVREALRTLSSQGLIQIQMGRGSFVADFSAPEAESPLVFWEHNHDMPLSGLLEVRLAIEPQIAALAARRASEEEIEQLRVTLDNLQAHIEADGLGGRVFADIAFHDCLVRASDNSLYLSIYRGIEPMLFDVRRMGLHSIERSARVLGMHKDICRAVESRDPDAAAYAMWDHLLSFASDMNVDLIPESMGLFPRLRSDGSDGDRGRA